MEPAATYTVTVTAETLLRWCAAMAVKRVSVSDTARHSTTGGTPLMTDSFDTSNRFTVVNSASTYGMVTRPTPNLVRTLKALLFEGRLPLTDWVLVVPVGQMAAQSRLP